MSTELLLGGAFRHGEAAAAAGAIQSGFAFTHAADVAFALGFPWARAWGDDVPADDVDAIVRAPRWGVCWPPSIGRARARTRGVDNVWIDDAGRVTPEAAAIAVRTTSPLSSDDARALVERGLTRQEPFGQLEMCLLVEADIGAPDLLGIIADALDRLSIDALKAFAGGRSTIAQFVGFGLLRVPAMQAPALRDRFEAIVRRAPVERQPYTLTGVLDRALHGRAGAERNGHAVGPEGPGMHPSSLWFVNDDAAFVRDQILLNDVAWPGFFVDSRCAFLGGPDVVRYYVQRWWDVDPSATTAMFDELRLLRDPAIVELMMMASGEPEHVETASAWMTSHRDHARPILEALARGPRKRMAEESARWLERLAQ
jgi:hypothetical protein